MENLKRQSLAALLQSSYMTAGDLENSAWIVSHTDLKKSESIFISGLTLPDWPWMNYPSSKRILLCSAPEITIKKNNILNKHLHIVWSLTNIREQWT